MSTLKKFVQSYFDYVKEGNLDDVKRFVTTYNELKIEDPLPIIPEATEHLHVLKYLHEAGCVWNLSVLINAVENGNFDSFVFAHDKIWDPRICMNVKHKFNNEKFCKFILDKKLPGYELLRDDSIANMFDFVMNSNNATILRKFLNHNKIDNKLPIPVEPVINGCIEMLEVFDEYGFHWDEELLAEAIKAGQFYSFLYIYDKVEYKREYTDFAKYCNNSKIVKFLIEKKVPGYEDLQ